MPEAMPQSMPQSMPNSMSEPMRAPDCHIVNLQPGLGGAEVFTMFFARAVRAAGCRAVLYAHPAAQFWNHLAADGDRKSVV